MGENFIISNDPEKLDVGFIHGFLTEAYWARNVSLERVKKHIKHSLNFGIYDQDGRQSGYCRVITDYSSFLWLADVFIPEELQGRGLGKKLLDAVVEHPELQGIRLWMLGTRTAHTLYHKYGFEEVDKIFMVKRIFPEYPDDSN